MAPGMKAVQQPAGCQPPICTVSLPQMRTLKTPRTTGTMRISPWSGGERVAWRLRGLAHAEKDLKCSNVPICK